MNTRKYAAILWLLLFLFILRVVGQVLVAFFGVGFLPLMEEWYSGLIPYPILLVSQILIIILLAKVCMDFTIARGLFTEPRNLFRKPALIFGCLYFLSMVARYIIRMSLLPEERWTGGTIPIVFHLVLASYVIVFSLYHISTGKQRGETR